MSKEMKMHMMVADLGHLKDQFSLTPDFPLMVGVFVALTVIGASMYWKGGGIHLMNKKVSGELEVDQASKHKTEQPSKWASIVSLMLKANNTEDCLTGQKAIQRFTPKKVQEALVGAVMVPLSNMRKLDRQMTPAMVDETWENDNTDKTSPVKQDIERSQIRTETVVNPQENDLTPLKMIAEKEGTVITPEGRRSSRLARISLVKQLEEREKSL